MSNAQAWLAAGALIILGVFGVALILHAVPQDNRELLSMIIGAIAGALTMGGIAKVAAHASTPGAQAATGEGGS